MTHSLNTQAHETELAQRGEVLAFLHRADASIFVERYNWHGLVSAAALYFPEYFGEDGDLPQWLYDRAREVIAFRYRERG